MDIEIRRARSAEDRLAGATLSQTAFARAGSVAIIEQAKRLKSSLRARGHTWLALLDGDPVSALVAYDFVLRRGDELRPAFGLGSVATSPTHRKRGIATKLCAAVADDHGGAGLLYSAIDAEFYGRLGYVAVPAWEFECADPQTLAASGPQAKLAPLDPRHDVERLHAAWHASHTGWYVDRDAARWSASLIDNPYDIWFAVGDTGYLRIVIDKDGLEIAEICTPPEERDAAIRAAAALAVEADASPVAGWFEPSPLVLEHFTDKGRATTQPMLRGLDAPETARFSSADYF